MTPTAREALTAIDNAGYVLIPREPSEADIERMTVALRLCYADHLREMYAESGQSDETTARIAQGFDAPRYARATYSALVRGDDSA